MTVAEAIAALICEIEEKKLQMRKSKYRQKIVVVRTQSLENLLQELWMQRPEIRDELSMTVRLAIAAFIRENAFIRERRELEKSHIAEAISSSTTTTSISPVIAAASTPDKVPAQESEPHPDSAWN